MRSTFKHHIKLISNTISHHVYDIKQKKNAPVQRLCFNYTEALLNIAISLE